MPAVNPALNHPVRALVFVCVENSCRSQIAEAFARRHGGASVEVYSAGSRPSGRVNPKAVVSMAEVGYDLTTHRGKGLADLPPHEFDVIVTMGCGDACPHLPARRRADWQIPDPNDMDPAAFRAVRDQIEKEVLALLVTLT